MKDVEAAYLAGLIDGEGTISIYRGVNHRCRVGFSYRPIIEISNTHKGVLQWAHSLIGYGYMKVTNPGNVTSKRHKPLWRIRVSTTDCRWVLPLIRPYLRIKGPQADVLMAYFALVTRTRPAVGTDYDAYHAAIERLTCEINQLNKRGTVTP